LISTPQPTVAVGNDELVIIEVWVVAVNPIDLCSLPRAEPLLGIEAPDSVEEPLTPEYLVAARNAAEEVIPHVEQSSVAISDL
jgi:hypothetical protein